MTATPNHYKDIAFDDLIRLAQQGDKDAVAYILLTAKFINYTFNFHLRKLALRYFKYGTDELFDSLINDLYIHLTKNDFQAIKSFKGSAQYSGEDLKRIFYSWLRLTASREFNEVRRKHLSRPECNIDKCVIAVPAEECTLDTDDEIKLREAIAMLEKDEQRIVLELSLQPGKAGRSVNIAKELTAWRQQRGNSHVATEADVNNIRHRAYEALRPILLKMGLERKMRKKVVAKTKNR